MQRYNWCVLGSNQNAARETTRLAPLCATVLCLHAALFPLMLELRSYVVDRQKEEASPLPFACEPAVRVGRAGLATRPNLSIFTKQQSNHAKHRQGVVRAQRGREGEPI